MSANEELDALWQASQSYTSICNERKERLWAATDKIEAEYAPIIAESMSVYYEVYARALREGVTEKQIADYFRVKGWATA